MLAPLPVAGNLRPRTAIRGRPVAPAELLVCPGDEIRKSESATGASTSDLVACVGRSGPRGRLDLADETETPRAVIVAPRAGRPRPPDAGSIVRRSFRPMPGRRAECSGWHRPPRCPALGAGCRSSLDARGAARSTPHPRRAGVPDHLADLTRGQVRLTLRAAAAPAPRWIHRPACRPAACAKVLASTTTTPRKRQPSGPSAKRGVSGSITTHDGTATNHGPRARRRTNRTGRCSADRLDEAAARR